MVADAPDASVMALAAASRGTGRTIDCHCTAAATAAWCTSEGGNSIDATGDETAPTNSRSSGGGCMLRLKYASSSC